MSKHHASLSPDVELFPRYLTLKEAAFLYSVSVDYLRRNKRIPKVTLGRRMVRIHASTLEQYFKENEN